MPGRRRLEEVGTDLGLRICVMARQPTASSATFVGIWILVALATLWFLTAACRPLDGTMRRTVTPTDGSQVVMITGASAGVGRATAVAWDWNMACEIPKAQISPPGRRFSRTVAPCLHPDSTDSKRHAELSPWRV
jgi:hypothetical protein